MEREINIKEFGKDHWSLFAYIETRCVDYKGVLDLNHLRLDPVSYPTRLFGYFEDQSNPNLTVSGHSDLDCIDDLKEEGLIVDTGTGLNSIYKLTDYGVKVASELRAHKSSRKHFAQFVCSTSKE